ncbi:MAG: site-specific DNA-methyltransferase [Planctomycetota bacterium]
MSTPPATDPPAEANAPEPAAAGRAKAAPRDRIVRGDCVSLLEGLPDESIDLAFADPPYNIGFTYDEYDDRRTDDDYLAWCERWIGELHRVVKPTGAFWLAIGDEYAAELKVAAGRLGFTTRNWVVWYYTFGQNCTRKFNRSHAHLLHFVKDEEAHTFNAADPAIRVPSARALVYGDRRANPTGRLPDDTWIVRPVTAAGMDWVLRPQDLREDDAAFHPEDDTWYFSRVAGTFKERQGFHGCQMPEQLLGRIVRVSSGEGDLVLDPFAGSGTTLAVAKKLGRSWLGFELSSDYAQYAGERIAACREGDDLSGPADPVRSAPTTAAGRRLKGHPMAKPAADPTAPRPEAERAAAARPAAAAPPKASTLRELQTAAIVAAFHAAADGRSLDRLLCDPAGQAAFHAECGASGLLGAPAEWNRELLKLRKAGKLAARAGKPAAPQDEPAAQPATPTLEDGAAASSVPGLPAEVAAEIAWMRTLAKHPDASLDEVLCDPDKAASFDRLASKLAPEADLAALRWEALRLRKSVKTHAAEAKRYAFVADKMLKSLDKGRAKKLTATAAKRLAGAGGVYLLTPAARVEPGAVAVIGEAEDLGARLVAHLATPAAASPLPRGAAPHFLAWTDDDLPGPDYRAPARWTLAHKLRPTASLDVLAATAGL